MVTNKLDISDVFCEFLEVAVHNILYARKLYPETIFIRKRKYGVVVYQSIHPDVNNYIYDCLKAVNYHFRKKQLKQFFIIIQSGDHIFEKIVFDIVKMNNDIQSDLYLLELEKNIRNFCLKLNSSCSYMDSLPLDTIFTIQIATTEQSSLEFNDNPVFEEFPWIHCSLNDSVIENPDIIPLQDVDIGYLNKIRSVMKRKGHLAVFENILEGSTSKNQQDDDSNDLIEEEETKRVKRRTKLIHLSQEPRWMTCRYNRCSESFNDYYKFNKHLEEHIKNQEANIDCQFGDCDFRPINTLHALQHISFHGYTEKLRNLGEIVARRNSLPDCHMEYSFNYPVNIENYVCEWQDCGMRMETYCDLLFHVKMHVNGNPRKANSIKCGWQGCSKNFTMLHQLTKHIPVHTKEKYIACPTCGNTFASLLRYSDHRSKQLPIEKQNYKCSQCSKHFATENLLRDHVRAHINQYKCSLCDMTCPKPSNLAIHMRYRHLNDRPFKCNLCDHASITKQNLEMHLITHCAEKLLACDECDFQCRSMVGLDRHIQREHGQNYGPKFECHICKKQYNRGAALTKHLIKAHGVQWPSGHSRFRYKEDSDGICRLQTIRYETVDVIKEILKNKNEPPMQCHKKYKCFLSEKLNVNGQVSLEAKIEEIPEGSTSDSKKGIIKKTESDFNNVLLTISDLDDQGNVVAEITESQKVFCKEEIDLPDEKLLELH